MELVIPTYVSSGVAIVEQAFGNGNEGCFLHSSGCPRSPALVLSFPSPQPLAPVPELNPALAISICVANQWTETGEKYTTSLHCSAVRSVPTARSTGEAAAAQTSSDSAAAKHPAPANL